VGRRGNRRRVDRSEQAAAARRRARAASRLALLLGAGALAVAAAVQGWRFATRGEPFRIAAVRFTGLEAVSAEELADLSPVKRGDNLLTADVDALARALERHPWLLRARAARRWPPAIEVAVVERRAVALVDLGGLYLVDREGQVFKRAAAGDGLDLPLVTGFGRDDYVQRRAEVEPLLRAALRIAEDWAAAGLDRPLPLSEVHLDGTGGVTAYAGEEGLAVRLGEGAEVPRKLERLKAVLAALRAEGRRAEVIHLDNRAHPSWVTVRPGGVGGAQVARGSGAALGAAP